MKQRVASRARYSDLDTSVIVPLLIEFLKDMDPRVRQEAVETLGEFGLSSAILRAMVRGSGVSG